MTTRNPDVDAFVSGAKAWQEEIRALRSILLDAGLDEALKWRKPCFLFEGSNVAIIQPFKAHCALLFFKGALFEDAHGRLRSQGENTRSAMRLEFTASGQIEPSVVRYYVEQAIAVEKAGLKVDTGATREPAYPEELVRAFGENKTLEAAFQALTPGRRRGYLLHFAAAKQSATRRARIEKCTPAILAGKGRHDR